MIRMAKDTVVLDICGMRPRTFGDENYEGPWRNHIADHVRRERAKGRMPGSHIRATKSDRFEVWMVFRLIRDSRPQDLDNLSKPVLDTLFCDSYSRKHVKGSLYTVDDSQIWKLHLEKKVVSNEKEEGVSIVIEFYTP